MKAVEFHGLDLRLALGLFICWEGLHQLARRACRTSKCAPIRETGATYLCSMLNALWCTFAGLYLSKAFLDMPDESRAQLDRDDPNSWAAVWVKGAAYGFLSWLAMDLLHCFEKYPHNVGLDALAHHGGFIFLTSMQMSYEIMPVVAAWLLLGELSTIPLNVRWFLISYGKGDSLALFLTNLTFAVSFLVVRVIFYWRGVAHMLFSLRPLLIGQPCDAPRVPLYILMCAVTAAGFLNLWWMNKILRMALRVGKYKKKGKPARKKR